MNKVLGNIAHHLQAEFGAEDAGVLALVFFQNVGLYRAAYVFKHPFFDFCRLCIGWFAAVVGFEFGDILINRGIHEHGQNGGCWTVDGHGHRCGWAAQIKTAVQHFHVVQCGNADATVAHFTVNVGSFVWIVAVQGN